eukprot:4731842-Karenia_brevis.AAC.1
MRVKGKHESGRSHNRSKPSNIVATSISSIGASGRAVRPPPTHCTTTQPAGQEGGSKRGAARSLHDTGLMVAHGSGEAKERR